jgi:hypothetical protein
MCSACSIFPVYHLSQHAGPEIELICKVYNINFGYNDELLDKCPVLKECMIFVDYVRENHKENDYDNLQDAIERAIDRCLEASFKASC